MIPSYPDHLILGINQLEKGIENFEALTGVRPEFSGVHPKLGTHNALLSLGENSYLEIIAPLDTQQKLTGPFSGFELMEELTVFGWAIGTTDPEAILAHLNKHKIPNTGLVSGSRTAPDGQILSWETIFMTDRGPNPFFIQWNTHSPHPSQTTPVGCELLDFTISSRENDAITSLLDKLAFAVHIKQPTQIPSGRLLSFSMRTPKGLVRF